MSTYGRSTATDPYPGPTAAGTEAPALELRHVHKRYAGGVDALVGIDVRVCAGEQVAVVGPSGSGKSTMLHVIQQFFLLDSLNALENVGLGLLYQDVGARERQTHAALALERVGLAGRMAHRPSELSGGERQRVAIARAIIGGPHVLFADEPTGNLDSHTGAQILDLLQELGREAVTLIVITHDLQIARRLPRQITMRDGQVASEEVAR